MKLKLVPGQASGAGDEALLRAIRAGDYLRDAEPGAARPRGYKEWFHFCVLAADVEILINFCIADDTRPAAPPGAVTYYLTVLARGDRWDGDVQVCDGREVDARPGRVAMRLGESAFGLDSRGYWISARLASRGIAADVVLEPITFPIASRNVAFASADPVRWFAVPRLRAAGTVRIGDRVHSIEGAPAYHDHNWGTFRWGGAFAWDWGFALPDDPRDPWSVVFVRLMDRARARSISEGIFLWKGQQPSRVLRGAEVRIALDRPLDQSRILKIPRVMGLASPGTAADVPRAVEIAGRSFDDQLVGRVEIEDFAQIVIPDDAGVAGITTINESRGRMTLDGTVRGEPVHLRGAAIVEFVRA